MSMKAQGSGIVQSTYGSVSISSTKGIVLNKPTIANSRNKSNLGISTMMELKYTIAARRLFVAASAIFSFMTIGSVANDGLLQCHRCGKTCQTHTLVEKTIMVPMKVIETRLESCVVENCEEREEKYTCFNVVPNTKQIKKECDYLADEVKTKKVTKTDPKLVDISVTKLTMIKVPQIELAEQTVLKEVCTECGKMCVEETCLCEKARMVDDHRTEQTCQAQLIFEKTTKDIFYCVKTPKKYTIDCGEETSMKLVPVEKTRKVNVMVPSIEKRSVEVEVTRMVPKKILCCEKCACGH